MKKKTLFVLVAFALSIFCLASCSNEETLDIKSNENRPANVAIRSIDQAVTLANQVAQLNGQSRAVVSVDKSDVTVIRSFKGRSAGIDTIMYVVNYGEENGFAIISAPLNVTPILAFIEEGSYGSDETTTNEAFQFAMDNAQSYVETRAQSLDGSIGFLPLFRRDTVWMIEKDEPRVQVKWNQAWPENIYCPNKVAGCAPIAIAQILSYFKEPSSIALTFDGRDTDSQTLDWDQLIKHVESTSYRNPTQQQQMTHNFTCGSAVSHNAIARLVRQIGQLAGSVYYTNDPVYGTATGTSTTSSFSTLRQLLSTRTFTQQYSEDGLFDQLKTSGVAFVCGFDTSAGGHAWVADGTLRYGYEATEYTLNLDTGEYEVTGFSSVDDNYIHYNWGWRGNCNGYFLEGVFDTTDRSFTDDNAPSLLPKSRYDFSSNVMYLHIK